MKATEIIGLIGVRKTPSFALTWLSDLVENASRHKDLIVLPVSQDEISKRKPSHTYDGIFVCLDEALSEDEVNLLYTLSDAGTRIVYSIENSRLDLYRYSEILARASLVVTEVRSIASAIRQDTNVVFLYGDDEQINGRMPPGDSKTQISLDGRRWLWLCDPKHSIEELNVRLRVYEDLTVHGSVGTVTIGQAPPSLAIPDWMEVLEVPPAITKFGGRAMTKWLVASKNRWDSTYCGKNDSKSLVSIYGSVDLETITVNRQGEVIRSFCPKSSAATRKNEVRVQQHHALSFVTTRYNLEDSSKVSGLIRYDKRPALARQLSAFPGDSVATNVSDQNHQPLVSILIPAFNRPEYLERALESALHQTYKNIEVIIGDDSTTNDVEELVRSKFLPNYKNITYWRNIENKGQYQNDLDLVKFSTGEFINFLMDDDLFHLDKVRRQMEYFIGPSGNSLGLVTSRRAVINADGVFQKLFEFNGDLYDKTRELKGHEAIELSLKMNRNIFGEPTTVLFRKSMLLGDFGSLFDRPYTCNVDHSTWLQILQSGGAVFISDALSAYRFHDGQQSWTPRAALGGAVDFCHATWELYLRGYLANKQDFQVSLKKCIDRARSEQEKISDHAMLDIECRELYEKLSMYLKHFEARVSVERG